MGAIDTKIAEAVHFWKIAVEGAEVDVIKSATKLFTEYKVSNIAIEISAEQWPKYGYSFDQAWEVMSWMVEAQKYTCGVWNYPNAYRTSMTPAQLRTDAHYREVSTSAFKTELKSSFDSGKDL